MSTKKVFVELVSFLETNKDKKISTVLDTIKEMTSSKKSNQTIVYDKNGQTYAIFCYYHKQWELLSEVEYGKKTTSKSGVSTMCKIGTSLWTKQQKQAKDAKAQLLEDVVSQKVDPKDLLVRMDEIETKRNKIDTTNIPKGTKEMPKA